MKERPILFSGPMVRALLAGTKTQTRRVVNPKLYIEIGGEDRIEQSDSSFGENCLEWARCPYGSPGDQLWVRETWGWGYHEHHETGHDGRPTSPMGQWCYYRATDKTYPEDFDPDDDGKNWRWRPSIHMPRWASRITLEVTEVRVQRLQDISEEDARAEGVLPTGADPAHYKPARDLFRTLWNDINEDRAPWGSNPWVWALSFHVVKP